MTYLKSEELQLWREGGEAGGQGCMWSVSVQGEGKNGKDAAAPAIEAYLRPED